MGQHESPRVLVPLAHGVEELGFGTTVSLLRRARCHVVTASVGGANPIVGSQRIRLMADIDLSEAMTEWGHDWDLVVILGGRKAAQRLLASPQLSDLLAERLSSGALIAAIGAGKDVLAVLRTNVGLDDAGSRTSTSCDSEIRGFPVVSEREEVVEEQIISADEAGAAIVFALDCVKVLLGTDAYAFVKQQIVT